MVHDIDVKAQVSSVSIAQAPLRDRKRKAGAMVTPAANLELKSSGSPQSTTLREPVGSLGSIVVRVLKNEFGVSTSFAGKNVKIPNVPSLTVFLVTMFPPFENSSKTPR
jgi:hypothetical protein